MSDGEGGDHVPDILNWCTENRCGKYPRECCGVNHPALCLEIEPDEPEEPEPGPGTLPTISCHMWL